MALHLQHTLFDLTRELRLHPTPWRIRGCAGPQVVADSHAVLLVWEPRRVTPIYAVPRGDLTVEVAEVGPPQPLTPPEQRRPVLDPSVPFSAHTTAGTVVELGTARGPVEGFVCDDPDLAGHVLIDFDALVWWEDDREAVAHPRDPVHRIDVRPTRSRLQLSAGGVPVVDTTAALRLQESLLPLRWYVPAEDVLVPLELSGTVTWCAYKGRATYRSAVLPGGRLADIAWAYEQPLEDARDVRGLLGFYGERLDAWIDGAPVRLQGMPGD